jgi:hypothetical protein
MPEDGLRSNRNHRLGPEFRFFTQTRAFAATQNHYFHWFKINGFIGAGLAAAAGLWFNFALRLGKSILKSTTKFARRRETLTKARKAATRSK